MHWLIEVALTLNVAALVAALLHARRQARSLAARLSRHEERLPAYGALAASAARLDRWERAEVARIKRLRDAEVASCRSRTMAEENRSRIAWLEQRQAGPSPRRLDAAEEATMLMRQGWEEVTR